MVKISNPNFSKNEALIFSILASIARLEKSKPFYRYIARFRRYSNPYRFHEDNVAKVLRIAQSIPEGEGLAAFALTAKDILEEK